MNLDTKKSVLIVDDTPENIDVLKGILGSEYKIRIATNGRAALKAAVMLQPDIILLDVMMPEMDGYEVCRILKADKATVDIPVIFVSALTETQDEALGLEIGAVDYISKPVNAGIVKLRVKNHLLIANQRQISEQLVYTKTKELKEAYRSAVFMLGDAGHYNDTDTGAHIWRMASYAVALARKVKWPVSDADLLELAAPMHDTGKIGIDDGILKAPRKLTSDEWEAMKKHCDIGYKILKKSDAPLFLLAAEIALNHHEKWDGTGYPQALQGEKIPESARIVAIADVFDALTMKRPYKEPWPIEDAFETIKSLSGAHFEPRLVDAFLAIKEEVITIKKQWEVAANF